MDSLCQDTSHCVRNSLSALTLSCQEPSLPYSPHPQGISLCIFSLSFFPFLATALTTCSKSVSWVIYICLEARALWNTGAWWGDHNFPGGPGP